MTKNPIKNLAVSIHQRLLNKAKQDGRPFNELLQFYAIERFLYRLSNSSYSEKFVLKGALMLTVWKSPRVRPTMDIDLLGRTPNDEEVITQIFREVCAQEVEPDGMTFDAETVSTSPITEEAEYRGIRALARGNLSNARVNIQIDIGFGDVVTPNAARIDYPTLLGFPAPRLLGYSRESKVAEKFHVMVIRGTINSRMKDFFDIWLLSRYFDFDGSLLSKAIANTFSQRRTEIPASPVAFSSAFAHDQTKQTQWQAFIRQRKLEFAPIEFSEVIDVLTEFLDPIVKEMSNGGEFKKIWNAPGPWV